MASIGLVGNAITNTSVDAIPKKSLPIGFDRIRWKLDRMVSVANPVMAYRLALIGLVGNCRQTDGFAYNSNRAYRLASIEFVGNMADFSTFVKAPMAYRLASIGLVGNEIYMIMYAKSRHLLFTDWLRSD